MPWNLLLTLLKLVNAGKHAFSLWVLAKMGVSTGMARRNRARAATRLRRLRDDAYRIKEEADELANDLSVALDQEIGKDQPPDFQEIEDARNLALRQRAQELLNALNLCLVHADRHSPVAHRDKIFRLLTDAQTDLDAWDQCYPGLQRVGRAYGRLRNQFLANNEISDAEWKEFVAEVTRAITHPKPPIRLVKGGDGIATPGR